jgi:hypothetical protein
LASKAQTDETDWQALSLAAFEAECNNPADAIYDDWRTLYHATNRRQLALIVVDLDYDRDNQHHLRYTFILKFSYNYVRSFA